MRGIHEALIGIALVLIAVPATAQDFSASHRLCRQGATASVAAGDLNGDGDPDLVFGVGRHWPAENPVVINGGDGAFLESSFLPSVTKSYSVALADFDDDGDLDVVEATDFGDHDRVYLNDGTGHFDVGPRLGNEDDRHGQRVPNRHVLTADLDGDGAPDVVTVARSGPDRTHLNDGTGERFRTRTLGSGADPSIQAAFGDLDGDSDLDLVVAIRGRNRIHWNEGDGTFPESHPLGDEEDESVSVAIADLDGQSGPEIIVGNERGPNLVYLNDGRGGYSEATSFGTAEDRTRAIVPVDVDRVGDLDLVVGNEGRGFRMRGARWVTPISDTPNRIYLKDGVGRLRAAVTFGELGSETRDLAVVDLDADGLLDIVEANNCGPDVVHFQEASGHFEAESDSDF